MMALKKRPIKFKTDADTYFDLAEDALEAGDYINAVHYFQHAYKKGGGVDALFFLGEAYTDMGEYEEALYYLFKALDKRPDCPDINNAIASCFLFMNDEDTALFYSWAGMNMKSYSELMFEKSGEYYQEPQNKIRLLEKNDQMIIDIAAKLLSAGDRKYASELLQTIKPDSDDFFKACNLLIMIALEDKKAAVALEIIYLALKQNNEQKESGIFLEFRCWEIVAYHLLKDKEKKEKTIDIIEKAKLDFRASRAAVYAYSKINDYKRIKRHIENVLKEDAFNKNMRVMLSLAYHLCGEASLAKDEIVSASKLYPNDITIKEVALAISQKRKGLVLAALLDKKTTGQWIDDVEEGLNLIHQNRWEDVPDKEHFKHKLEWVFQSRLNNLATHASMIVAKLDEFKPFLLGKLIDYNLDMPTRKLILYTILTNYPNNKFGIVLDGFYQRINFKRLKTDNKMVFGAYCKTFATLIFMEHSFETRLFNSAKKIEEKINELGLGKGDDDMLAALMFQMTTKHKLPISHSAFIFSCDEKELVARLDKLKGV